MSVYLNRLVSVTVPQSVSRARFLRILQEEWALCVCLANPLNVNHVIASRTFHHVVKHTLTIRPADGVMSSLADGDTSEQVVEPGLSKLDRVPRETIL